MQAVYKATERAKKIKEKELLAHKITTICGVQKAVDAADQQAPRAIEDELVPRIRIQPDRSVPEVASTSAPQPSRCGATWPTALEIEAGVAGIEARLKEIRRDSAATHACGPIPDVTRRVMAVRIQGNTSKESSVKESSVKESGIKEKSVVLEKSVIPEESVRETLSKEQRIWEKGVREKRAKEKRVKASNPTRRADKRKPPPASALTPFDFKTGAIRFSDRQESPSAFSSVPSDFNTHTTPTTTPDSTLVTAGLNSTAPSAAIRADDCGSDRKSSAIFFGAEGMGKGKSVPHNRPKAHFDPCHLGVFKALNAPTSGFSSTKTLENASEEEKINFAAMFTRSIDEKTLEMRDPDEEPIANEDARDAIAYASMARVSTDTSSGAAESTNTNYFSVDNLLRAVKEVGNNVAMKDKRPRRRTPSKKNGIFFTPVVKASNPKLAAAQARHSSSTPLRFDTSFPDKDNVYYHAQMTLASAAPQIVTYFRYVDKFIADYCDHQKVYTSSVKPTVTADMESIVRNFCWLAQLLYLGRPGWDLVTLPHEFFDVIKSLVLDVRTSMEFLSGLKGLNILEAGMSELDKIEMAVCRLQESRRTRESLSKVEWETQRAEEARQGLEGTVVDGSQGCEKMAEVKVL